MVTRANAALVASIAQRFADFLASQSPAQLDALAAGRLVLAAVEPAPAPQATPPATVAPARGRAKGSVALAPAAPKSAGPQPGRRSPARRTPAFEPAEDTPTAAAIAEHLRSLDSIDEGAAYLSGLKKFTVDAARAVGKELKITVTGRKDEMIRKILNQAIGARRKYAGLSAR